MPPSSEHSDNEPNPEYYRARPGEERRTMNSPPSAPPRTHQEPIRSDETSQMSDHAEEPSTTLVPPVERSIRWIHPSLRRDWRFFTWANVISAFSGSSATFGIVVLWAFTKHNTPVRGQVLNAVVPLSIIIFGVFCFLQWHLARRMFSRHICAHIPRSLFREKVHLATTDIEARKDALRSITRWNWYLPVVGVVAHVVWAFSIRIVLGDHQDGAWLDDEGFWAIVGIGIGLNFIYAIRLQAFDPVPLLSLYDAGEGDTERISLKKEATERKLREVLYAIRSKTLIYQGLSFISMIVSGLFTGIFASMSSVVESAQALNKRYSDDPSRAPKVKTITININSYDAHSMLQSTFVIVVTGFIAWNFPSEQHVEGRIALLVLLGLSVLSINFIDLYRVFFRSIPRPDSDIECAIAATFGAMTSEVLTDRFMVKLGKTDPSVDLWRRWVIEQRLIEKLDLSPREEGIPQIAVAMFDIDDFGMVNKKYSHEHGDELLRGVATCIYDNLDRRTDMCARWGGEEFVMVFLDTGGEYAKSIAESVRRDVEAKVWLEKVEQGVRVRTPGRGRAGQRRVVLDKARVDPTPVASDRVERRITISAGVAATGEFGPGVTPSFNELIGLADARMRYAKQKKGKNCVANAHDLTFDEAVDAGIIKNSWSQSQM